MPPRANKQDEANKELLANLLAISNLTRRGLDGLTHNGTRDLYAIFGYKKDLTPSDFSFSYKRGDIAHRIVNAYPDAIWANPPEILDDPDIQDLTPFEEAVNELFTKMNLWSYLRRADVLSCLGRFSVLLLGYAGSSDMKTKAPEKGEIKYIMPYGEANVRVHTTENEVTNERFGKPLTYMITVANHQTTPNQTQTAPNSPNGGKEIEVHYSRIMHFAEGLLDNDIYGSSILERVYNRLQDLEKVIGGSAEVYWLNSRGGLNLNADKDAKISDPEKLKQEAEDYVNQLSRILKTQGMDVNTLQLSIPDPEHHVDAIVSVISGSTGIPRRILTGSEEGKLASTQDEDNWLSRVNERRIKHNEPFMVRPLIDLLIEIGMLPAPKDGKYKVKWPELITVSEKDTADIAVKVAQALSAYVNAPGADLMLTPKQFVVEILKMPYLEEQIAEIEREHEQEEEEALRLEVEGSDLEHQRQKELVEVKTGGLGGGGTNSRGGQVKPRVSEPGSVSPKSSKP